MIFYEKKYHDLSFPPYHDNGGSVKIRVTCMKILRHAVSSYF